MNNGLDVGSVVLLSRSKRWNNMEEESLFRLYQPIIGANGCGLMRLLYQMAPRNLETSITLGELYKTSRLFGVEYEKTLSFLEGIGLVEVFEKFSITFGKIYKYILHPPKDVYTFFQDKTLTSLLMMEIGPNAFDLLVEEFKKDDVDETSFINVTKSFESVYGARPTVHMDEERFNIGKTLVSKKETPKLSLSAMNVDLFQIKDQLRKVNIAFDEEKDGEEILILHTLYGLNESEMVRAIIEATGIEDEKINFKKVQQKLGEWKKKEVVTEDTSSTDSEEYTSFDFSGLTKKEIALVKEAEQSAPIQFWKKRKEAKGVPYGTFEQTNLVRDLENSTLPKVVNNLIIDYLLVQKNLPSVDTKNQFNKAIIELANAKISTPKEALDYLKNRDAQPKRKGKSQSTYRNNKKKEEIPEYMKKTKETKQLSEAESVRAQKEADRQLEELKKAMDNI